MTYTTSAIVLKNSQFREYDKLVTIYTHSYGKITALARGTLKIKSKLCGHLEPFVCSSLMIAKGRTFDIVAQSSAENVFPAIRRNFLKTITANVALEAVNACTHEGLEDELIFHHLRSFLVALERAKLTEKVIARQMASMFLYKLLKLLGHEPSIEKCAQCKCLVSAHLLSAFDFAHSSLLCHKCYDGRGGAGGEVILNEHDVRTLQNWAQYDFADSAPLQRQCTEPALEVTTTSARYLMDGKYLSSLIFLERYCTI
ncbi:MAG: repair protein RecO protein [Parcubacteria group bacterium GW2011_GWA2_44_12]|nr:MAG: repair protein RecO protein [Parcubacteria group bacterium GW2011_GWA2_44_12]